MKVFGRKITTLGWVFFGSLIISCAISSLLMIWVLAGWLWVGALISVNKSPKH